MLVSLSAALSLEARLDCLLCSSVSATALVAAAVAAVTSMLSCSGVAATTVPSVAATLPTDAEVACGHWAEGAAAEHEFRPSEKPLLSFDAAATAAADAAAGLRAVVMLVVSARALLLSCWELWPDCMLVSVDSPRLPGYRLLSTC